MMRAELLWPRVVLALCLSGLFGGAAVGQTILDADAYIDSSGAIAPLTWIAVKPGQPSTPAPDGATQPADARVHSYPGGIVCPGLVDCIADLGVRGGTREPSRAVQPELVTADVFSRYSSQYRAALRNGVTTVAITPDRGNLVAGTVAVAQTASPAGGPVLLSRTGPLVLSLDPGVLLVDREPTSRGGAIAMLRAGVERWRKEETGPLAEMMACRRPCIVFTPTAADVRATLSLFDGTGVRPALVHTDDARHVAGELKDTVNAVVVGPLGVNASLRDARAPGVLERAGVPVAIAGGLPGAAPDSLRIGAAVAVRHGMSPDAARRAITFVPASVLGIEQEYGVSGGLVVFSGDPIDLRSRVVAVYVDGRRVFYDPSNLPAGVVK